MKKIRTLFLLPVILFASCTPDTEMTTYPGKNDEAFFNKTKYSHVITPDDPVDSYSVEVLRANPAGNASVGIEIESEIDNIAELLDIPQNVEFADGEYTAELKISFDRSKLTAGKDYTLNVILESETALPYSTNCSLTIYKDFTYHKVGTGEYTAKIIGLLGQSYKWSQTIEVADDDPTLYRLPDFYGCKGYHLSFTWDGSSGEITFTTPADEDGGVEIETGYEHPVYGGISLYIDPDPDYTGYDPASQTFIFSYVAFSSIYGQVTNWIEDTFVLDTGLTE